MKVRVVKQKRLVARSIEDAFEFFSNPRVLESLTPSTLRLRLLGEPPLPIEPGTVLNYKFYYYRLPILWQVRIESVDPPYSFTDVQQKGPFAHWRHSQTFVAAATNSTEVLDRFEYGIPFGRVGEFAYRMFLKSHIRQLLDYRANQMDMIMHRSPPKAAKVLADSEPPRESQP
jgi:ligand-binding SRPBCC domain-containing protein